MSTTVWDEVKIPTSDPSVTTRVHAAAALRQLERLRREVDAAWATVTIVLGANSRDTAAEISRATGRSNRQARRDTQTAQTVETLPAAGEALAKGEVSAEHVAMLHPLLGLPGVAALLEKAATSTVDEFRDTVQRFELDARGDEDMAAKQHKRRLLRFFDAELGMLGITGLLPPVEGARLRAELEAIADRTYRATNPERADVRGGHDEEPLAARLADALVSLVNADTERDNDRDEDRKGDGDTDRDEDRNGDGDTDRDEDRNGDGDSSPNGSERNVERSTASACRTAVVMTLSLNDHTARVVGQGPVPFTTAMDLAVSGNVDLYAAILDIDGEILNLGRVIDVAQVNKTRHRHRARQSLEIKRAKGIPFGNDRHCFGTHCHGVGIIHIDDIGHQTARNRHPFGIVSGHNRTGV